MRNTAVLKRTVTLAGANMSFPLSEKDRWKDGLSP